MLGCGHPNQAPEEASTAGGAKNISQELTRYESALQQVKSNASASLVLCHELEGETLRQDCILAVAPELAKEDLSAAEAACDPLKTRAECYFRIAESLGESSICEKAGPFELDCRMHVFSFSFNRWLSKDADVPSILAEAPKHIEEAGLLATDFRPWTALWRWRLGAATPIDRTLCQTIPESWNRETCFESGLVLFGDRLNHFRDKGQNLCEGPLPPALTHTEDDGLKQLLSERRGQDLCDPTARKAPPSNRIPGSSQ